MPTSFSPRQSNPCFNTQVFENRNVTSYADAAHTVTAAELISSMLIDTRAGAQALTLPTATLLVAAIPGAYAGTSLDFIVRNTGNNTCTVAVGTGGTSATGNTLTVATVNTRWFRVVITGILSDTVVGSSNTYTLYSLGVSAH